MGRGSPIWGEATVIEAGRWLIDVSTPESFQIGLTDVDVLLGDIVLLVGSRVKGGYYTDTDVAWLTGVASVTVVGDQLIVDALTADRE